MMTDDPTYAFAASCLALAAQVCREDHRRVARLSREGILHGDDIDFSFATEDIYRAMCEDFRDRFHPEARNLWAALFDGRAEVHVVDADGSSEMAFDAPLLAVAA